MLEHAVCPLCRSRFCLVKSPTVCITLHRQRDVSAKSMDKPARDTALKAAPVTK